MFWNNCCFDKDAGLYTFKFLLKGGIMEGSEKILLAVDGSDNALEMVRYAGQFIPFKNMKMVLYNVSSSIPDTYWDIEMQPGFGRARTSHNCCGCRSQLRPNLSRWVLRRRAPQSSRPSDLDYLR